MIPYSLSRLPYLYFAYFPLPPGFSSLPLPKELPFAYFLYWVPRVQLLPFALLPHSVFTLLSLPKELPFPISLIRSLRPSYGPPAPQPPYPGNVPFTLLGSVVTPGYTLTSEDLG